MTSPGPESLDTRAVERAAVGIVAWAFHSPSELDTLRYWHKSLTNRQRDAYRGQAAAALAALMAAGYRLVPEDPS